MFKNNRSIDISMYKQCRNKLAHVKEKSKCQYYDSLINESSNDPSRLWKTINDIIKFKEKCQECLLT